MRIVILKEHENAKSDYTDFIPITPIKHRCNLCKFIPLRDITCIFLFLFFLSGRFAFGQQSAGKDTTRKNISSPLPAVTATKISSSEKRQTFTSPEPESKVEKEKSKQAGRGQFNSSKPMNIVIPKETKDKDKK